MNIMSDLETDDFNDFSQLPCRLDSFRGSRLAEQVPPERLARAGFFFTGHADRVQCFSCKKTVENWCREDTPVERHKAVSPTCTFLSCTHRGGPLLLNNSYNEAAEDMQYRLRTGEVVDETIYPKVPHMRSEEARLETFESWPSNSHMRPTDLAQAGLYYMGQNDHVQCFCCAGMIGAWEPEDNAWGEHEKLYPNCFFILGHDVGNEPRSGGSQEEEGSRGHGANNRVFMGSFEERLQSFQRVQHPIDHERLAQAGFYSTGTADKVMCFYCGGGLKGWHPEEDPWEEHAKHYPGCHFLQREKGQEFINSIQLQSRTAQSHQNGFSKDGSEVLQSRMAQEAIQMGLEPSKVERIILERLRTTGTAFPSVQALVEACFDPPDSNASMQDDDPLKTLEKLQREKQCKICMDRDICMVFIPCGHLVCCQQCSAAVVKCPICCGAISQKIKTYVS